MGRQEVEKALMWPRREVSVLLNSCLLLVAGCSSASDGDPPHRQGAKINLPHFMSHTAAYRGKSVNLRLKVDEPIVQTKGQSLRDYVGRDVKFRALGPRGEQLRLVITIPPGVPVPEVGNADEVIVTFVCTRGNLRQGNEARSIESP
jgi:hypothetical protein